MSKQHLVRPQTVSSVSRFTKPPAISGVFSKTSSVMAIVAKGPFVQRLFANAGLDLEKILASGDDKALKNALSAAKSGARVTTPISTESLKRKAQEKFLCELGIQPREGMLPADQLRARLADHRAAVSEATRVIYAVLRPLGIPDDALKIDAQKLSERVRTATASLVDDKSRSLGFPL